MKAEWMAMYHIDSDDGGGPWELLTRVLPNKHDQKFRRLHEDHGDRLHYRGVYMVDNPSRQEGGKSGTTFQKIKQWETPK